MAEDKLVLLVRHFPSDLTAEEKEDLLKHFGAVKVRCMSHTGKMKHTAFASFDNKEDAKYALTQLHQLEVLGCQLIVEYAKSQHEKYFPHISDIPRIKQESDGPAEKVVSEKEELHNKLEEFSKNLHGVAPSLGLDYLPSPLLKYKYPPPTPSIITNIAHTLAAVPKFYTQVLHLMNKMNLPVPFGPITPAPPLQPDIPCAPPQTVPEVPSEDTAGVVEQDVLEEEEMEMTSTEESELESDEDTLKKQKEAVPVKRESRQPKKGLKKPKLQKLLKPPPSNTSGTVTRTNPADVFESPVAVGGKKIQFNIKQSLESESTESVAKTDIFEEPKSAVQVEEGGFGVIAPQKEAVAEESDEDVIEESWNKSSFISSSELRKNRISEKEIKVLSVFKNYQPGEPNSRLYVKNLAKQTDEKDLRFIYGRFINRHSEEERNMFDIRVMKEGRMKGQAFVTLFSDQEAITALKETNGFVLHGKPLIVQFARSAKPKQTENKKSL